MQDERVSNGEAIFEAAVVAFLESAPRGRGITELFAKWPERAREIPLLLMRLQGGQKVRPVTSEIGEPARWYAGPPRPSDAPNVIAAPVLEALAAMSCEGNVARSHADAVERRTRRAIEMILKTIGARWKPSLRGFVFPKETSAKAEIDAVLRRGRLHDDPSGPSDEGSAPDEWFRGAVAIAARRLRSWYQSGVVKHSDLAALLAGGRDVSIAAAERIDREDPSRGCRAKLDQMEREAQARAARAADPSWSNGLDAESSPEPEPPIPPAAALDRGAAARRAWATRDRKQPDRGAAARKAWATRRSTEKGGAAPVAKAARRTSPPSDHLSADDPRREQQAEWDVVYRVRTEHGVSVPGYLRDLLETGDFDLGAEQLKILREQYEPRFHCIAGQLEREADAGFFKPGRTKRLRALLKRLTRAPSTPR